MYRDYFNDPQLVFRNVSDAVSPVSKQIHFSVAFRGSKNANREPTMPSEVSLSLRDILPTNPKYYDKNRAPKPKGQPTTVYFHVTVLSLDSINEESMVRWRHSAIQTCSDKEKSTEGSCLSDYPVIPNLGYDHHHWLDRPWWTQAFLRNFAHSSRSRATFLQFLTPNILISWSTTSAHRNFGQPLVGPGLLKKLCPFVSVEDDFLPILDP